MSVCEQPHESLVQFIARPAEGIEASLVAAPSGRRVGKAPVKLADRSWKDRAALEIEKLDPHAASARCADPPNMIRLNQKATLTRPINTGTSTNGPMTAAKAAP